VHTPIKKIWQIILRRRHLFVYLVFLPSLILITVSSSSAKLDINAAVGLREEYNDNIFLTRTDRKEDFITRVSPSVVLKYSHHFLDLSLDYGLNFIVVTMNAMRQVSVRLRL